MDIAVEATLAERLLAHIEAGSTALAPDRAVRPVADYVDATTHRREVTRIFWRCPAVVAHVSQLSRPGDYLAGALHGLPFVVVTQPDGTLRAFVNACRHRGAQVVAAGCSHAEASGFSCPWHGWRYDLAGDLTGVPDRERGFPGLPPGGHSLVPLRTEVRHGFVWLTLSGDGSDVATYLGDLDTELRTFGIEGYLDYGTSTQVGKFNWKLGIEAFLETYHFRWLHPAMNKYVFAPDLSLVDGIGRHVRLIAPKKSILAQQGGPAHSLRLRPHATIMYCVFPSTMVFVEKRHVSVMSMHPTAPDETEVRFIHLVPEDTLRLRSYWDENIQKFMDAVAEDFQTLEAAQRGFPAVVEHARTGGRESQVTFGRNEAGLQMFRVNVDAMLAERVDGAAGGGE
jgi:phenylpropionate dioxygenase-like ring-hydroxylating dioxygenase large terminal subunit